MVKQDKFIKFYTFYLLVLFIILVGIWMISVTTISPFKEGNKKLQNENDEFERRERQIRLKKSYENKIF